jgi:hypothetical protein
MKKILLYGLLISLGLYVLFIMFVFGYYVISEPDYVYGQFRLGGQSW